MPARWLRRGLGHGGAPKEAHSPRQQPGNAYPGTWATPWNSQFPGAPTSGSDSSPRTAEFAPGTSLVHSATGLNCHALSSFGLTWRHPCARRMALNSLTSEAWSVCELNQEPESTGPHPDFPDGLLGQASDHVVSRFVARTTWIPLGRTFVASSRDWTTFPPGSPPGCDPPADPIAEHPACAVTRAPATAKRWRLPCRLVIQPSFPRSHQV